MLRLYLRFYLALVASLVVFLIATATLWHFMGAVPDGVTRHAQIARNFHILLALFGKERHGYDIMQQVKADSGDTVKMGPGTLYGSLDRMIEARLVARGDTDDPRRVYYRLTAVGQTTLRAETGRLSRVALVARRQLGRA